MSTILITGAAGFVGSHLADLLLQDSTTRIAGLIHPTHEVQHLEEHPRVTIYREDILKETSLRKLIKSIAPARVYHLAGMAHVQESFRKRKETIQTNFIGSFNLLEACRSLPDFPRVLLIGSADCYGVVPQEMQPITEERAFSPSSPYAVSKIAQETLGIQYARSEKLPVYLSRSFNHTGPRQKETFVCSAFAKQIARAEMGMSDCEIRVGNLDARRDFSDVRDVVRAYQTIVEHGIPGEPYNVCSGKAVSIAEVLRTLLGLSQKEFQVTVDPSRVRPTDLPLLLGDYGKLQKQTGWAPHFSTADTMRDLLDYWRSKLKTSVVAS
jgi:GDP-4-dehydro-6-deoxy-D-mannose reductase